MNVALPFVSDWKDWKFQISRNRFSYENIFLLS